MNNLHHNACISNQYLMNFSIFVFWNVRSMVVEWVSKFLKIFKGEQSFKKVGWAYTNQAYLRFLHNHPKIRITLQRRAGPVDTICDFCAVGLGSIPLGVCWVTFSCLCSQPKSSDHKPSSKAARWVCPHTAEELQSGLYYCALFRVPTAKGKQGKWSKNSLSGKRQGFWKFYQNSGNCVCSSSKFPECKAHIPPETSFTKVVSRCSGILALRYRILLYLLQNFRFFKLKSVSVMKLSQGKCPVGPCHLSVSLFPTESESVNAIVLDLTGIDLAVTTKEDLNKETRDEALSTISFTPEPTEVQKTLNIFFCTVKWFQENIGGYNSFWQNKIKIFSRKTGIYDIFL